jgi:hypothetical protein
MLLKGVIPKGGVLQPPEGSPSHKGMGCAGDPSLRLKSDSAQDDATEKTFKLSH